MAHQLHISGPNLKSNAAIGNGCCVFLWLHSIANQLNDTAVLLTTDRSRQLKSRLIILTGNQASQSIQLAKAKLRNRPRLTPENFDEQLA